MSVFFRMWIVNSEDMSILLFGQNIIFKALSKKSKYIYIYIYTYKYIYIYMYVYIYILTDAMN